MVGENCKRSHSGRSPDPRHLSRKIARIDHGSAYLANSNIGQTAGLDSRRSSFSQANAHDQISYDASHSRPPTGNGHPTPVRNIDAIPKALESFVVAVSKHSESVQHLKNVETDYGNMLPRYTDFPGLGTQRTNRLTQAQKDFEATEAQTAEATSFLRDALNGYFPEQVSSATHQDCVSRLEFHTITEQLRAENYELKRRLNKLEDCSDREIKSAERSEDRITELESANRATIANHKSLQEQTLKLQQETVKDRLSCRNRCSTLELEVDRSKTKHKDNSQAIDAVRSTFDDHVSKSQTKHEEHARNIGICRSRVEALQQKLDIEVNSKIEETSKTVDATHEALQNLEHQFSLLPAPSDSCRPAVADSTPTPALEDILPRLESAELLVERRIAEATDEHKIVVDQIEELQSNMDKMQLEMIKLQSTTKETTPGKRGFEEQELKTLDTWRDMESRMKDLKSDVDALTANTTARIQTLHSTIKEEMKASVDEAKQGAPQEVPEGLKPQLDYISETLDNHITILQKHEFRLNSVTTDELCKLMENQWRSSYGVPEQMKGLVNKHAQLESLTKRGYKDLNKKIVDLDAKYEGKGTSVEQRLLLVEQLEAEIEGLVKRIVG